MERMIMVLVLLLLKEGTESSGGRVIFENLNPCAVKGYSVELKCSHRYEEEETAEYERNINGQIWTLVKMPYKPYKRHFEYLGDQQHNCSFAIHDVQEMDAGYYHATLNMYRLRDFRSNLVHLSVTELSARACPDPVRAGENVILECETSCNLPPSIVWFKDGRPISKPVFQAQAGDFGNYACAIEGQESAKSDPVTLDVQYAPLNVSIEMSHPGLLVKGSNVSLTCSDTANPAAENYTWYKALSSSILSSMLKVGSGQVLTFTSLNVTHSGLYFCRVRNSVGEGNSMGVLLMVYETEPTDINYSILRVGFGVKAVIVLLLTMIIIWACKKMRGAPVDKKEHSHDYENVRE